MTSWVMNRENGLDPEERKDERKIDKNENEQKKRKRNYKEYEGRKLTKAAMTFYYEYLN